jgi:hypothetical protein
MPSGKWSFHDVAVKRYLARPNFPNLLINGAKVPEDVKTHFRTLGFTDKAIHAKFRSEQQALAGQSAFGM